MGTPSADNLYVGAGRVYFSRYENNAFTDKWRHLGDVSSLTTTNNITEIEHRSSQVGARSILKKLVTGTDVVASLVMHEYDLNNLGLALLGDASAFTQSSEAVTDEDINDGDAIVLDEWYSLGAVNVDVDSVDQGGPLTVDEDYEVDSAAGLIRILSTGAGSTAPATWSGTRPGLSGRKVFLAAEPRIVGGLRYVSAEDQVSGPKLRVDLWKVSIRPEGVLPFIQAEFGAFTLQATVELDETKVAGEQYGRVIPLNELVETS